MWSVSFKRADDELADDELAVALWESGTCGVVEETESVRAFFSEEMDARALAKRFGGSDLREVPDVVSEQPLEDVDPILVGEHFYIAQQSAAAPVDGRLRIAINSSGAFGTGRHETTQLCLQALESCLRRDDLVVDVGCGSGILSLGAALLGTQRVFSCDIFEDTIRAARQNIGTPVFVGSADAVASASADLVLANLTGAVLDRLAAELRRIAKPEGRLVISGFLRDAPPQNFRPQETFVQGDWSCWICKPEDIVPVGLSKEGLAHASEWWL